MITKIIIAEDHPLFSMALQQAVLQIFPNVQCKKADSIGVLQQIMESNYNPDMILLDLQMPGAYGFSAFFFFRGYYPDTPVVIISAIEDEDTMVEAMQLGAKGYIPKSTRQEILRQAIGDIAKGGTWFTEKIKNLGMSRDNNTLGAKIKSGIGSLTPQQFRILGLVADGMLNKQIGYQMAITEATVKSHVTAIFRKLNVKNRTQAVLELKNLENKKQ